MVVVVGGWVDDSEEKPEELLKKCDRQRQKAETGQQRKVGCKTKRQTETKGDDPLPMQTTAVKSVWPPLPKQSAPGYYSNECNRQSDVMYL